MKRILNGILFVALILMAGVQLVRVTRENPPIDRRNAIEATATIPPEVHAILQRSCNDCHSNETIWPWYSRVAPISWILAFDVREGRDDLNFSEWGTYSAKKQGDKLQQICARVRRGEMPDGKYTLIHRNARLTAEQQKALCAWAEQTREALSAAVPTASSANPSVEDR